MNTQHDTDHQRQRGRKGQTLAEFAITLPILLILTFGIIEFGRIFQAWVTLQNAARAGARYASTGQYDEQRFQMDLEFLSQTVIGGVTQRNLNDPTGFIPCVDDGTEAFRTYPGPDQRGTPSTVSPNGGGADDVIHVYNGGLESLFATWNSGINCEPGNSLHQEWRKDMARILSIMEVTRQGAAGLLLEANSMQIPGDKTNINGWPWFEVWKVPFPNEGNKSWFNVTICSNRAMNDRENSENYFQQNGIDVPTRYVTYLGDAPLRDPSGTDLTDDPSSDPRLPSVGCMLNESLASTAGGLLNNAGKPWLDPGGPSDTVTVIVTFNHPLVTPLGLAPYIRMQARRSAIVESFRSAEPNEQFQGGGAPEVELPTNTPQPTFTPLPPTPSPIPSTATMTATVTPTRTQPPPFSCELISITPVENGVNDGIFGNRVGFDIRNDNAQETFLTRVILRWPTIQDFPGMYVSEFALNSVPHWKGRDVTDPAQQTNTTDTNTDSSIPANYFTNTPQEDRTIFPNESATWSATFGNGAPQMSQYVTIGDFGGSEFYLFNPLSPTTPCIITFTPPPPQPTATVNPNNPTNTPTYTPDCVGPQIGVVFRGFEQFGIVRLEVISQRSVVSALMDFTIQWRQRAPGVLTLDRVTAIAPPGQPGSVEVWNSGSPTQDANPPTTGRSEGNWVQNFVFPANSATPLFIDFGGVAGRLSDSSIGMTPSDFNGSQFRIGCGGPGGTGGPGGNSGLIHLAEAPTPRPTNTPGPSNTPRPTLPPSATPTKGPPTAIPTVGPTNPPRPTDTPLPPATATTRPPPPTPPGGGCQDGCG